MDIAFEIRVLHHLLRFPEDGFVAAGLDDPALVEGQGAERTGPEAAPVADQAVLPFQTAADAQEKDAQGYALHNDGLQPLSQGGAV